MIKIAIIGYGKMGKEIHNLSAAYNCEVTHIFDIDNPVSEEQNYEFDVAVDFSFPDAVIENCRIISNLKKNLVIGTTGWYNDMEKIKELTNKNNTGTIWGSNFSTGMNVMFKISEYAAKLFDKLENYDVFMHEFHHRNKKDSPSGTAIQLANILLNNISRKNHIESDRSSDIIAKDSLHVTSTRGGSIPGTHTIYFDSPEDTIEIKHTARSRTALAAGALMAVGMIHQQKGFYEFSEKLNELWNSL